MSSEADGCTREDFEQWRAQSAACISKIASDPDRLKFHLMPEAGWLNDPNGLVEKDGIFHLYYQYNPFCADKGGANLWNHCVTRDFVHYKDLGPVLFPDRSIDVGGVYSGSAFVEGDCIHYFYTGNVKHRDKDDYDYILSGREANIVHVTSDDGQCFSAKHVVLSNVDYPQDISCHVRDPKILKHEGMYYMVLGARTRESQGCVLVYTSNDLESWEYSTRIVLPFPFGYMWECPDMFYIGDDLLLICCPQGVEPEGADYRNAHQCVVFRIDANFSEPRFSILDEGRPRMLDRGFDFYAPQTFEDDAGRRILIGWVGVPDSPFVNRTAGVGWQHALSVPRELHVQGGRLFQLPIFELNALRGSCQSASGAGVIDNPGTVFDLLVDCPDAHRFDLRLRQGARLMLADGVLSLDLQNEANGRGRRSIGIAHLQNLRILSDTTMLEVFVNNGEATFTSRAYSAALDVLECSCDVSTEMMWYQMKALKMEALPRHGEGLRHRCVDPGERDSDATASAPFLLP